MSPRGVPCYALGGNEFRSEGQECQNWGEASTRGTILINIPLFIYLVQSLIIFYFVVALMLFKYLLLSEIGI